MRFGPDTAERIMPTAQPGRQDEAGVSVEEAFAMVKREPDHWAVFLDIDGCLLDLAPTPDEIYVPPDLPGSIEKLRLRLGGALALVTGRGLSYADALFDPFPFPIAGLHGAEMRQGPTAACFMPMHPRPSQLKAVLVEEAKSMPGVLIEDKGGAVAGAHYRLAPAIRTGARRTHARLRGRRWSGLGAAARQDGLRDPPRPRQQGRCHRAFPRRTALQRPPAARARRRPDRREHVRRRQCPRWPVLPRRPCRGQDLRHGHRGPRRPMSGPR